MRSQGAVCKISATSDSASKPAVLKMRGAAGKRKYQPDHSSYPKKKQATGVTVETCIVLCSSDEAEVSSPSDDDFDFMCTREPSKPSVVSTTAGTRKRTKNLGLRALFEGFKPLHDPPRPRVVDPQRRIAARPVVKPRDPDLVPARWPPGVLHLADNFNPDDIPVPGNPPYQMCSCERRGDCRFKSCENAKAHVYCDETCCPFSGLCGNGTRTNDAVQLMRVRNTDVYALQAAKRTPTGVVLGEYLGILSLQPKDKNLRTPNEGFRLHYHADRDVWGSQQLLCVDARLGGSLMRFLNHSCTPTAEFNELFNSAGRVMVATTIRDIDVGEEITVDYGDDLWFECKCETCESKP